MASPEPSFGRARDRSREGGAFSCKRRSGACGMRSLTGRRGARSRTRVTGPSVVCRWPAGAVRAYGSGRCCVRPRPGDAQRAVRSHNARHVGNTGSEVQAAHRPRRRCSGAIPTEPSAPLNPRSILPDACEGTWVGTSTHTNVRVRNEPAAVGLWAWPVRWGRRPADLRMCAAQFLELVNDMLYAVTRCFRAESALKICGEID